MLGHCTFIGLTNRLLLSIFHSIYAFIRKEYYTPSRLWDSVREELIAFRGLMIFLQSDWARPWNDLVACSDSSTTGYGVSTAYWPRGTVGECGRILERTRFKRVGGCDARESALTSAGFVRDSVTGDWVAGDIPSSEYLDKSGWSLDQILTLEARALVKSLKRIAMSIFGHDVRQLLLVDNMSVCLAFDRSRARNFPLLVQIRRFASYCLARNIQCSVRWVPSELNNSDSPSRYYSDEPSKLLTDAIPGCKPGQEGEDFEGPLPKESRRGDTKDQDPQAIHGLKLFNSNAIVEEAQPDTSLVDTQEFRRHFGLGGRARLGCGGHPDEEKEESRQQFKQHQLNPKSQGEKDVGQPEKQGTASIQAHGGSAYGRSEPIAVGESSSDGEHFKAVFPGAQPVHGLWPAKRVGHQGRSDDGWDDGRVPEPDVPSRPSVLSGGPPDCSRAPLYYPEYGRMGAKRLPRTWRAIRGYRKAYPLALWCAMAVELKKRGRLRMSVFLMLSVSTYARPSELLRARLFSMVRPHSGVTGHWSMLLSPEEQGTQTKTGEFDASLILDSPYLQSWGDRLFEELKKGHPEERLWEFDYGEYNRSFREAAKRLGVVVTPYQTRHSGPSIDRSRNYRSQHEVQRRGQWRSRKSVNRYEKSARLAATWEQLPAALRSHCQQCEADLGAFLLGQKVLPVYLSEKD